MVDCSCLAPSGVHSPEVRGATLPEPQMLCPWGRKQVLDDYKSGDPAGQQIVWMGPMEHCPCFTKPSTRNFRHQPTQGPAAVPFPSVQGMGTEFLGGGGGGG